MGNLNDYFRAADDGAAAETGDWLTGPLAPGEAGRPPFDGVDAKGIDGTVILGQLIAIARQVEWSVDLVSEEMIFPSSEELTGGEEGPWVSRLSDQARDALADIDDARFDDLARRWAQIEEFGGYVEAATIEPVIAQLAGLARRARAAGEHLYCWSSL
jgi:hypothetical protein